MSCCGENRDKPAALEPSHDGFVHLEFTGQSRIKASRVPSGTVYRFSPESRRQAVLPADASALLRTGYFRRI